VNETDTTLRRFVAAEHGLQPAAAKFLTGATIAELEESAARLADLLGKQRPPERTQRPPSMFSIAAAEKAERKRTLVNALCGRFPQPRDTAGRYTRPATDFGGGARQPVPPAPPTHEQTLMDALRSGASDVGANL
jgi:hypothetical protein